MPFAPGRFSTTTFCASRSDRYFAKTRTTTSVPPPVGQGTIKRNGRLGKVSARTGGTVRHAAAASSKSRRIGRHRRVGQRFIVSGLVFWVLSRAERGARAVP